MNTALDTATAGFSPYTSLGTSAAGAYADLMGLGGRGASGGTPAVTDWEAYVRGNPDALANWDSIKGTSSGAQFGGDISAFGQYHYAKDGSRRDLSPFTSAATGPTGAVTAEEAQAQSIAQLENSPLFKSLIRNGEEGILANAAATGGLRGGNTIDRLTDFRADTLAGTIQNQLAGYQGAIGTGMGAQGSLTSAGFAAAGGQNASQQMATDALIQKILGKAGVNSQNWNNIGAFADKAASGGGIGKAIGSIGKLF
ncbi:hypothetical protein [Novosphingobium sp. M1R2S20]|uniref:Uncharacterized protein n=1 Tax=Novosphingobium rhizovicinum TaxID=3228928 RepID=A0ABV3RE18_9SPHN